MVDPDLLLDSDEEVGVAGVGRVEGRVGLLALSHGVEVVDEVEIVDQSWLGRIGVLVSQQGHLAFAQLRSDEGAVELTFGDFAHLVPVELLHRRQHVDASLLAERADASEKFLQPFTFVLVADVSRRSPRVQVRRRGVGQTLRMGRQRRLRILPVDHLTELPVADRPVALQVVFAEEETLL